MLHRIMTNNDLEALNNKSTHLQLTNSQKAVQTKLKNQLSILPSSSHLHSQGSCEILADQNSNSNSDESSESIESGSGDQRTMDAADTLLSIANTPTTEFKPFLVTSSNISTSNMLSCEKKNFEIVRTL
jgi:hypothetical protein